MLETMLLGLVSRRRFGGYSMRRVRETLEDEAEDEVVPLPARAVHWRRTLPLPGLTFWAICQLQETLPLASAVLAPRPCALLALPEGVVKLRLHCEFGATTAVRLAAPPR